MIHINQINTSKWEQATAQRGEVGQSLSHERDTKVVKLVCPLFLSGVLLGVSAVGAERNKRGLVVVPLLSSGCLFLKDFSRNEK